MIYHNILQANNYKKVGISYGIEENSTGLRSNIQEVPPDEIRKLFLIQNTNQYTWKDINNLFNMCMGSRSVLFTMQEHFKDQSYVFSTIKELSVKWVDSFVEKLGAYSLYEIQKFLIKKLDILRLADTREDAYSILSSIQQYVSQIFLWIDVFIPWKEICETYAEVKGDKKPYI